MHEFLMQYEMKTAVPLWVYPAAGIFALALTILVVSTQALRAAKANPVKSLRSE